MPMRPEVIIPSFREYLEKHATLLNIFGLNSPGGCRWGNGPKFSVEGNTVTLETEEASPDLEWLERLINLYDDYIEPLNAGEKMTTVRIKYTATHQKILDHVHQKVVDNHEREERFRKFQKQHP